MSGSDDSVAEVSFCGGASEAGVSHGAQRRCVSQVAWFGLLEPGGELVGVVEDFLCGARHRDHLRYFGRAAMAWTMIGPSPLSITPISRRLPVVSAPTRNRRSRVGTSAYQNPHATCRFGYANAASVRSIRGLPSLLWTVDVRSRTGVGQPRPHQLVVEATKLLIRSALGDMSPNVFPACLGGPWSSQVASADADADRRARICHYAASSLLLGWLTFDGFMMSAFRLGDMSERRRDQAIAAVAAHLWALADTDETTLESRRVAIAEPVARELSRTSERSTRDTLLASAIELFSQRGPASVSIRDVARHAGLNHGLLHRHFGSKDALIAEAIDVGVGSLMPGALAPGGFDIDQVVQVMHDDPVPARLIARTVVDGIDIGSVRTRYPVMDGVLALARRVPAESRPPSATDPRIAAVAAAWMVGGSVIWGPSLQETWGFHDEVRSAMADLTRHLLGTAQR